MTNLVVPATVDGEILVCSEGLSFWGGVDAATGTVIDAHHPQCGKSLTGKIVLMPTSRGSCTGSGVLLELAMNGRAPAALIFREHEDILTLGALIATNMFNHPVAVVHLSPDEYDRLTAKIEAKINGHELISEGICINLNPVKATDLVLSDADRDMLAGKNGNAAKLAMETLCTMAAAQNARSLTDVTRAHIDGCIYASPANLVFAKAMVEMGAKVRIPTTMNAISVDHANWRSQNVPLDFGLPASQLADSYVQMGARPSFTCAPYLLEEPPGVDEEVGWSESNAVIFANSVLGARTAKHPDFLDLFIAITGRAPLSGVYCGENRIAQIVINVETPENFDDAIWPLLGWISGQMAPDRIPLLKGLENTTPSQDDLKALCAAFGTTSAAPMLHVAGITPESNRPPVDGAAHKSLTREDLARAWTDLNTGGTKIELVALGSPHFSLDETRLFAGLMNDRKCHEDTSVIVTLGRDVCKAAKEAGLVSRLQDAGVKVITDLCWCSISEPVFPPGTGNLMTNSGKYAHYAPGLCGSTVRFGSLEQCADAAQTGYAPDELPDWLK
ncbi:MAG: aconitase X [Rhizobiaceae bacterium]